MTATKTWSGDRLKRFRLRKGWSQDELARAVPTSVTNVSRYERNKNKPGANMVARLAHALEIDEGELFSNGSEPDEEDESELAAQLLFVLRGLIRAERERVA